jgi:transcriptional regulator with XRE-family HTH domain
MNSINEMSTSILKFLGARIRDMRKSQGLSQEQLAEVSGLHHTYIGAVERGERNISIKSLLKITDALKISMGEVFESVDPDRNDLENRVLENRVISQVLTLLRTENKNTLKRLYLLLGCLTEDATKENIS